MEVSLQRRDALALANRIRMGRAALKREMRALPRAQSCRMAADLVAEMPEIVASMLALELLRPVKGIGSDTAPRILKKCGIGLSRTLESLTTRQRQALESALRDRAAGTQTGHRDRRP
jgi:hypothetical protein